MSETTDEFRFGSANNQAQLAVFQAVIAECQPAPGHDGVIVRIVAEQVQQMFEDDVTDRGEFIQSRYDRWNEVKRMLTRTPAHGLAGLRAKAILVRRYTGPGSLQPTGAEDDVIAWSLAGDLLGLPSAIYDSEGHGS
jgi:hypothetical protein